MLAQQLLVILLIIGVGLFQQRFGHSPRGKPRFQHYLENVVRRRNDGSEQHELEYLREVHCKQILGRWSALFPVVFPGCKFGITLALYAVNACARIPEMALRVTASIVGLTTSRDEKSRPVILDMVAEKTVVLSSAV
jgi:hypothetical protein